MMRICLSMLTATLAGLILFIHSDSAYCAQPFNAKQTEHEVMAVLDRFMAAFNAGDAIAEESTYHFPHYRLAGGTMRVFDAAGAKTEASLKATHLRFLGTGWDHSAWTRRKIVHLSANKAHVDTQFTRYRKDGSVIARFDSLYVLTKENGRWGIKLRSSFAP